MKLCLGTFFRVFYLCKKSGKLQILGNNRVTQGAIFERFFEFILNGTLENSEINRIFKCKNNTIYSNYRQVIRDNIAAEGLDAIRHHIWKEISVLIHSDKFEAFLCTLAYIVQLDDDIGAHTPLNIGEEQIWTFGQLRMDEYESYVTSLFLYAALNTKNDGAEFLDEITPEFLIYCTEIMQKGTVASQRIEPANAQIPTISTHTSNRESVPIVSTELVLGIIWDNSAQRLAINDETQNRLKELYREFQKHGTKPVDIIFDISCITGSRELAEFLLRDDIASQYGYESALHVAEQELLTRIKAVKELLTVAFCHLFQDEMVDSYAARNSKRYVEKYGVQNCSYIDVDGIGNPSYYWTPYLWIEIVEEILKELLYSRYEFYYNSHDYIPIDCVARNRNGEEVWSFCSCMPRSQLECENKEIYWQLSHGCADMYDMPTQTLAEHILPDLYINISLLKTRNPHEAEALLTNYPKLFNLSYYSFGLH